MPQPNASASHDERAIELGLRANWRQFWLLVLVNAFVGAMVGLERTVLPLLAEAEFGLVSSTAALSFIATFGAVKAITNVLAGRLGDAFGRRRVLIAGWLFAAPVPFLVIYAPSWNWILLANVLLGVNQGLAWSTTVIMKIDLVGPRDRGLAMGLNEFAGYLAVALAALATGFIAERFGLRPEPFYLGIAIVAVGLALVLVFVRETKPHADLESLTFTRAIDSESSNTASADDAASADVAKDAEGESNAADESNSEDSSLRTIIANVSWRDPALSSVSQAGLVNNLNDGLAWGAFPLFFAAAGLGVSEIGTLAFVYPAVWGALQLVTGPLSDRWGRKWLIAGGMVVQGIALAAVALASGFGAWLAASALLGVGTAMVYPTLLASIGDVAHPRWRGSAVGVYRMWRDAGYVVGALVAGVAADRYGMSAAILIIAGLTAASGAFVALRMPETHPRGQRP